MNKYGYPALPGDKAPTISAPAVGSHLDSLRAKDFMEEESTGTSIMAVEFDGGVVIGADSRTTSGAYIANRVTDKLTKVTDSIYVCRSGSAADTQALADLVSYQLDFYEMETAAPAPVEIAANLFRTHCYDYRDQMTAGMIVAGWDKDHGGQVYTVPVGGMIVRQACSIGGSGSTYVYGYVDANFKTGMSKEECAKFVTNTLTLAIQRDGSSGGVVRLAIITKDGVERRITLGDKLPEFWQDWEVPTLTLKGLFGRPGMHEVTPFDEDEYAFQKMSYIAHKSHSIQRNYNQTHHQPIIDPDDLRCDVMTLQFLDILFAVAQQYVFFTILVIWFVCGLQRGHFTKLLPYKVFHPKISSSQPLTTLYFVRIFFSQRSSNFEPSSTRVTIHFHYTDMTSLAVELDSSVLKSAIKYRAESCANFFVQSVYHVGVLNGVSLNHDSQGYFRVEYIEVQRLDNDPKTRLIADVSENIYKTEEKRQAKYMFDEPEETVPDFDLRPSNTITLFEITPFIICMLEIASMANVSLMEHYCTSDSSTSGCSKWRVIILGSIVGILAFFILSMLLYFYINVVRKGLFNNLGMDNCKWMRYGTLAALFVGSVQLGVTLIKMATSDGFKQINLGKRAFNCDSAYTLCIMNSFFTFYTLLGLGSPIYLIYRTNYENECIFNEEGLKDETDLPDTFDEEFETEPDRTSKNRRRSEKEKPVRRDKPERIEKPSPERIQKPDRNDRTDRYEKPQVDDRRRPSKRGVKPAGRHEKPRNRANDTTTDRRSVRMKPDNRNDRQEARKPAQKPNFDTIKPMTIPEKPEKPAPKPLKPAPERKAHKKESTTETEEDDEGGAGYALQMMKLEKVRSISQYVIKKR